MPLLVRKINRAKWERPSYVDPDDHKADAITSCLRTSSDQLSVWEIGSSTEIDNAILAIASTGQRLETIDVIWFEKKEIENIQIAILNNPANDMPVRELRDCHKDLDQLTYKKIGIIASLVKNTIDTNNYRRCYKDELKYMLNNAITRGKLNKDNLHDKIVEKL